MFLIYSKEDFIIFFSIIIKGNIYIIYFLYNSNDLESYYDIYKYIIYFYKYINFKYKKNKTIKK